jgi:hypothetical protein
MGEEEQQIRMPQNEGRNNSDLSRFESKSKEIKHSYSKSGNESSKRRE